MIVLEASQPVNLGVEAELGILLALIAVGLLLSTLFRNAQGSSTLNVLDGQLVISPVGPVAQKYRLIGAPENVIRVSRIQHTNLLEILILGKAQGRLNAYLAKFWGPAFVIEFKSESEILAVAIDSVSNEASKLISAKPTLTINGLSGFRPTT
jgi:hypothetical protein